MKKIFLIAALLLSPLLHAQDINSSSFDRFMHRSLGGGLHTVGMASNGTPIVAQPITGLTPGGGWVRAGQMSVGTHPDGLEIRGQAKVPVAPNVSVPVNVASRVSAASVIASMQRCMGNFACFMAVTAGSAAIGQWLEQSGIGLNPNPTSENDVVTPHDLDPSTVCVSSCYSWTIPGYIWQSRFGSAYQACLAGVQSLNRTIRSFSQINDTQYSCVDSLGGSAVVYRDAPRQPDDVRYTKFDQHHAERMAQLALPPNVLLPLLQAQHQSNTGIGIQPEKTGVTITGTTITPDSPVFTPETNKTITTETIKNPDGSTSTKETTKQTHYAIEPAGDGQVKVKPITTTEVKIDGVPVPEQGKTEDGKTNPEQDIETCGLPNTPACKINEEGTPEAQQDTHKQDVDNALSDLNRLASNPASFWPTLPEIRWDFALPTGCAAIAIPAFEPWLQEIDVCQFQPIFHDIMSAVWVLGGLFGAISIFWRSTFAKAA